MEFKLVMLLHTCEYGVMAENWVWSSSSCMSSGLFLAPSAASCIYLQTPGKKNTFNTRNNNTILKKSSHKTNKTSNKYNQNKINTHSWVCFCCNLFQTIKNIMTTKLMHSTHFIYGYMASDIWYRTIQIAREETRCRHMGYCFRLAARVLLYAPFRRRDNT